MRKNPERNSLCGISSSLRDPTLFILLNLFGLTIFFVGGLKNWSRWEFSEVASCKKVEMTDGTNALSP